MNLSNHIKIYIQHCAYLQINSLLRFILNSRFSYLLRLNFSEKLWEIFPEILKVLCIFQ